MLLKTVSMAAVLSVAAVIPVHAQQPQPPMHGHDHTAAPASASVNTEAKSTAGFQAANDKMHKDMAITYSGNADVDFVRSMIPHHQGAIDMAKVELEYGKDPELRKLAEAVIKAQEAEIAEMEAWLKAYSK